MGPPQPLRRRVSGLSLFNRKNSEPLCRDVGCLRRCGKRILAIKDCIQTQRYWR